MELVKLMDDYPTLGDAYRLKSLFNDLWAMPNPASAEAHLTAWSEEVQRAGIQPFMQFAKTVKAHCVRTNSTACWTRRAASR